MSDKSAIFIPMSKVDLAKREVWGVASEEIVDRAGEKFDYASNKLEIQKWSEEFSKASDGKSLGNLRSMHKAIAAGKLIALTFDDESKKVLVGTKVVDDDEWKKVEEGVYTGFSWGGRYKKRWKDPEDSTVTRYTSEYHELSLVDLPCVPTATYTLVKADGLQEERKFSKIEEAPKEPTVTTPAAAPAPMKKGMYDVAWLARIISDLKCVAESALMEANMEGDNSAVPAQLKTVLAALGECLVAMATEESAELVKRAPKVAPTAEEILGLMSKALSDEGMKEAIKAGLAPLGLMVKSEEAEPEVPAAAPSTEPAPAPVAPAEGEEAKKPEGEAPAPEALPAAPSPLNPEDEASVKILTLLTGLQDQMTKMKTTVLDIAAAPARPSGPAPVLYAVSRREDGKNMEKAGAEEAPKAEPQDFKGLLRKTFDDGGKPAGR